MFSDKKIVIGSVIYVILFTATMLIVNLTDWAYSETFSMVLKIVTVLYLLVFLLSPLVRYIPTLIRALIHALSGRNIKYRKNLSKLRKELSSVILTEANRSKASYSLASAPILEVFDKMFSSPSMTEGIAKWGPSFDYIQMAYKTLYTICHNCLSSGYYHAYRGLLSPVGESILSIYFGVLDYYEHSGLITSEQHTEQISIIQDNISAVG